jgi:hypothetical protein
VLGAVDVVNGNDGAEHRCDLQRFSRGRTQLLVGKGHVGSAKVCLSCEKPLNTLPGANGVVTNLNLGPGVFETLEPLLIDRGGKRGAGTVKNDAGRRGGFRTGSSATGKFFS